MPGNLSLAEHSETSFVVVLYAAYPDQPGPTSKEPMAEFHLRACLGSPMGERHAEPIRGDIDELPSERYIPALLNQAYFAFTNDAQFHPPVADQLFLALVRERNTEEVGLGYSLLPYTHVGSFVLKYQA